MFEEFWRSGAPLVGHAPGAVGWGAWMAGSEPPAATQQRQRLLEAERQAQQAQQAQQQEQQSGWEELAPAIRARFGHALRLDEGVAAEQAAGGEGQGSESGEAAAVEEAEGEEEDDLEEPAAAEEDETDEQLLERYAYCRVFCLRCREC